MSSLVRRLIPISCTVNRGFGSGCFSRKYHYFCTYSKVVTLVPVIWYEALYPLSPVFFQVHLTPQQYPCICCGRGGKNLVHAVVILDELLRHSNVKKLRSSHCTAFKHT